MSNFNKTAITDHATNKNYIGLIDWEGANIIDKEETETLIYRDGQHQTDRKKT